MIKPAYCEKCVLRGYSVDLCKLHLKMAGNGNGADGVLPDWLTGSWGKSLAVGACAGVAASGLGLAVVSSVGVKSAIELALAVKLTAAAGVGGAAYNVSRKKKTKGEKGKSNRKKKVFLPPLYLEEG